jgi:hypothetical protein
VAAGSGERGLEQEDILAYRCRARSTTPSTMAAFCCSLVGTMVALSLQGCYNQLLLLFDRYIDRWIDSPPIGRGLERRPKCMRSGDTGSKPHVVPCRGRAHILRGPRPLRVRPDQRN